MIQILFICSATFLSACLQTGEAGQSRGGQQAQLFQATPIDIKINSKLTNAEELETSLKEEFSKIDQEGAIKFELVEGDTLGERYFVEVGSNVPASTLMRVKKVLRLLGASQASFRTEEVEHPNHIYIGKPA